MTKKIPTTPLHECISEYTMLLKKASEKLTELAKSDDPLKESELIELVKFLRIKIDLEAGKFDRIVSG